VPPSAALPTPCTRSMPCAAGRGARLRTANGFAHGMRRARIARDRSNPSPTVPQRSVNQLAPTMSHSDPKAQEDVSTMRRLTLITAMAAIVALGAAVFGARSATHADEPAGIQVTGSDSSNDLTASFVTAHKWVGRTKLEVYSNWDGGSCLLQTVGGVTVDRSGPASTSVSPELARQTLRASIQDINNRLRGGLESVRST